MNINNMIKLEEKIEPDIKPTWTLLKKNPSHHLTGVKAIKTWIRTKSGRLVERIVFLSEEDYEAFKAGKNVEGEQLCHRYCLMFICFFDWSINQLLFTLPV